MYLYYSTWDGLVSVSVVEDNKTNPTVSLLYEFCKLLKNKGEIKLVNMPYNNYETLIRELVTATNGDIILRTLNLTSIIFEGVVVTGIRELNFKDLIEVVYKPIVPTEHIKVRF